ncbi:mannitol dehydrogenase family protein [Feifania hominis]|uniref:Mannitol dehydrogenase family protein n=1 Tax=Feifania hominis TaxID=2763660 RepID=A0A926HTQ5_9FIRM|nr:mannitol dehydrogenase family protein [Feifania hominis]MBC8535130.1 mannitol dehydrogenase family protein [Feifania hominis]
MKLTTQALADRAPWEDRGYQLPKYDREEVIRRTHERPIWLHLGAGNIFRAFLAADAQRLLDRGWMDTGIIVGEGYDCEIIEKAYRPFDNLALSVTLKPEGSIDKVVVGSITESLAMQRQTPDWARLEEVMQSPSLQMVSFTITEKGYNLKDQQGRYFQNTEQDFARGPDGADSYMGKVAALLYKRFLCGGPAIALVSMDNCSHNGTRLYEALRDFASKWESQGLVEKGFLSYVEDREKVGFPWSMIDKITPRPDAKVVEMLKADGFEDTESLKTKMGSFVAPFVNAEQTQYLVVEDWFPNGRPPLDKAGVIFTQRETVDQVEKMKVCTCLNPLHTALAVFGCLLGFTRISDEMKDEDLRRMVEIIGYKEGLPVVVDPGILDPRAFLDTVIHERFPNVFMPDSPQRIATDTSQKLAIRFGETIKAYLASDELAVDDLKMIPLVFAGWCRYLMGVDDRGNAFERSDDPMFGQLLPYLSGVALGDTGAGQTLRPILSNDRIFGVDLYAAGLGQRVESYFAEMLTGPGAVRETLHRHVSE